MRGYLRILFIVPCLALLGFGGCDSKTEDTAYIDTIGPMSSVEAPGEDFVMDLDVVESEGAGTQAGTDARKGVTSPEQNNVLTDVTPDTGQLFEEPELVEPIVAILDEDQDGIDDTIDNCLYMHNPTQADTDHDGFGNECDGSPYGNGTVDTDQDGITNESDNCPEVYNPGQEEC